METPLFIAPCPSFFFSTPSFLLSSYLHPFLLLYFLHLFYVYNLINNFFFLNLFITILIYFSSFSLFFISSLSPSLSPSISLFPSVSLSVLISLSLYLACYLFFFYLNIPWLYSRCDSFFPSQFSCLLLFDFI